MEIMYGIKVLQREVLGVLYRYTLHMNVKFVMLSGGNI